MVIDMKKLVHVPSRSGRDLQRYNMGRRQVVGCIPYRLVDNNEIVVLMVSSQKGETMMFPKGGWEKDESSMEEAALRESLEEAGVLGSIQLGLGKWIYKSKNQDTLHDGYMFPLLVEEQLDYWPEKDFRQRKWVTVKEAKELCAQIWMMEALELLVQRLANSDATEVPLLPCFPEVASASYHLEAPLNRDEGQVSSSSDISINAQLNLVEVEGEATSFTICSVHRVKRSCTMFEQCRATCTTTVVVS